MKQLTALIWKEWHEVRVLFAIALFVSLGLPVIGGIQFAMSYGRLGIDASLWVYFLGGLLAIVVGVGIVTRDVNGKLEEFWRSRPVTVTRWLLVKYLVGVTVVLFSLMLPVLIERFFNRGNEWSPTVFLWAHSSLWIAFYSIAFAAACLIRRGAHAAMLAVAIALLVYFLPTILPVLRFLSIVEFTKYNSDGQLEFSLGMAVIAAISLLLGITAMRRNWHVEVGRKMLYWSVGASLLLLFASAASQVAANMQVLQTINTQFVAPDERIVYSRMGDSRGLLLSRRGDTTYPPQISVSLMRVSRDGVEVESHFDLARLHSYNAAVWDPAHPDVLYSMDEAGVYQADRRARPMWYPKLVVTHLRDPDHKTEEFPLPQFASSNWTGWPLYVAGERLYYWIGDTLIVFDISDPTRPRMESAKELKIPRNVDWAQAEVGGSATLLVPLQEVEGLTPIQLLELVMSRRNWRNASGALSANMIIRNEGGGSTSRLVRYELERVSNDLAIFKMKGWHERSLVQQLFTGYITYSSAAAGRYYEGAWGRLSDASITAYDVSSNAPRPIGHFAFKNDSVYSMTALPDGRLLATGMWKHYLLAAPPLRK